MSFGEADCEGCSGSPRRRGRPEWRAGRVPGRAASSPGGSSVPVHPQTAVRLGGRGVSALHIDRLVTPMPSLARPSIQCLLRTPRGGAAGVPGPGVLSGRQGPGRCCECAGSSKCLRSPAVRFRAPGCACSQGPLALGEHMWQGLSRTRYPSVRDGEWAPRRQEGGQAPPLPLRVAAL